VPNSTSLPCLIDNIHYIASINQVTVTGLQFQPTPLEGRSRCVFTDADFTNISKKAATEQVEFTINVSGTYSNVGQFIASMGQMSRLVTLKSINLNKQEGQSMVASINGLGFYFLDEKQNTK
jgi:Tfp pilus assembly protein PilO